MAAKNTMKVGQLWMPKIGQKDSVEISRPDGSTVKVLNRNGYASHVLDIPGVYRCGDEEVTAK